MEDNLTNEDFWKTYWVTKNLEKKISRRYLFSGLYKDIVSSNSVNTALEIGGFPGVYSIYLKKYLHVEAAFADIVFHEELLRKLEKINEVGRIEAYKGDIFTLQLPRAVDLVHSHGFIEHFKNAEPVFDIHMKFLNPGGIMFITIPNFRGFNGWIQKAFNPENYRKHNIDLMIPASLKKDLEKIADLENFRIFYYGGFSIWLDNFHEKSFLFKLLFRSVWFIGKVISKIIPVETKAFSPYVIIIAKKKGR